MRTLLFIVFTIWVATAALLAQPQLTLDEAAMARKIVERLGLTPGERVISVAHPGTFAGLIPPRERWRIWADVRERYEAGGPTSEPEPE